jgi:large subunit ribosomal protein L24
MKFKLKRDDLVMVTAGKHKGKTGKILKVVRENQRVIVEKVNMVKRQVKPTQDRPGGTIEKEASIHISNVALWSEDEKRKVKVGVRVSHDEEGKRQAVRYDKKTQQAID